MPAFCDECGAVLPESGSCRDYFYELLALEAGVPDAPGGVAHFYAVSCYVLQHPDAMEYTEGALAWLRTAVGASLAGDASIADLRRGARSEGKAGGHVLRKAGDPAVRWSAPVWRIFASRRAPDSWKG